MQKTSSNWFLFALSYGYISTLVMALVLYFAFQFIHPARQHADAPTRVDMLSAAAAWDGQWYRRIATSGYWYRPDQQGPVAFFPLYPWMAAALIHGLSLRPEVALLVISNVSLFAFCGLFHRELLQRNRPGPISGEPIANNACVSSTAIDSSRLAAWTVAAFLCYPMSFFLRAAYPESLFLLIALLALTGMRRQWPIAVVALLIGLATACRPVGVALILPFWWNLWHRQHSMWHAGWRVAVTLPLCLAGLLVFMSYLNWRFESPLAFAQIQQQWTMRSADSWGQLVQSHLTLAPLIDVYREDCLCHWSNVAPAFPLLNARFLAPILLLGISGLVLYGGWKRWLHAEEILYSAVVLGIPFLSQGYRICMNSQGRYAILAFPAFLVAGHLLAKLPLWFSLQALIASAALMLLLGALFASWYPIY